VTVSKQLSKYKLDFVGVQEVRWEGRWHRMRIMNLVQGFLCIRELVSDRMSYIIVDSHNNLNRWKNYFSLLLYVHDVSDVWQTEVHTAEPLVPGPSRLEVECNKSVTDQIFCICQTLEKKKGTHGELLQMW
jgi:hypothetical protein